MRIKSALILIATFTTLSYVSGSIPKERTYLFRYSFTIKDIPVTAKEIRIWVPYPAENSHQKVGDLSFENLPVHSGFDRTYANRMLHYDIKSPKVSSLKIERVYKIRRSEFVNTALTSGQNTNRFPESELKEYISQDGVVVITDYVRKLAAQITESKATDIKKARAIYDFLFEHMTYDKSSPGWGKGDIERVCMLWSGNCTDFHSFFIALCRACGIPAKFVIGVPLPEKNKGALANYHCWAEFYAAGYGWVPIDISEAWKDKSRYEYYFGAVDENRIELSHGRGISLKPLQKNGRLNYFVFPYVEIDGKVFENVETMFSYEDIT